MAKSSLDVLRLQWSLGSKIIGVMKVYSLDAKQKADVLDIIVRDLRQRQLMIENKE